MQTRLWLFYEYRKRYSAVISFIYGTNFWISITSHYLDFTRAISTLKFHLLICSYFFVNIVKYQWPLHYFEEAIWALSRLNEWKNFLWIEWKNFHIFHLYLISKTFVVPRVSDLQLKWYIVNFHTLIHEFSSSAGSTMVIFGNQDKNAIYVLCFL